MSDVIGDIPLIHDLTTQSSGIRTHVDEVVGGTHHLLVMLHDDHGITQSLQLLEHLDEPVGIPAVQSDAGLV